MRFGGTPNSVSAAAAGRIKTKRDDLNIVLIKGKVVSFKHKAFLRRAGLSCSHFNLWGTGKIKAGDAGNTVPALC
jgi:hypothetical protein